MCGSKTALPALPRFLAWYMAMSAALSRLSPSGTSVAGRDPDADADADLGLAEQHRARQ
jgi:hypothetical protein